MKTKLLVLIAIAVLIGAWYFLKPKQATAPEVSQPTGTVTIIYTGTGFEPQSITVKPGATVTFFNQSQGEMWVASALHPTHLELPGFDELKGEPRGAKYSFTFDQVGTWKFHDHLNSQAFGSVVVSE